MESMNSPSFEMMTVIWHSRGNESSPDRGDAVTMIVSWSYIPSDRSSGKSCSVMVTSARVSSRRVMIAVTILSGDVSGSIAKVQDSDPPDSIQTWTFSVSFVPFTSVTWCISASMTGLFRSNTGTETGPERVFPQVAVMMISSDAGGSPAYSGSGGVASRATAVHPSP